jgi:hypothetical protein
MVVAHAIAEIAGGRAEATGARGSEKSTLAADTAVLPPPAARNGGMSATAACLSEKSRGSRRRIHFLAKAEV